MMQYNITSRYLFLKIRKYNRNINASILRGLSSDITSKDLISKKYKELAAGYCPGDVEKGKYDAWEKDKGFTSDSNADREKVYSLVLPPPNVTGSLHLGHALTATLQDVISRFKRMNGYNVTWVPGTDHAGIATQAVVEKKLSKEGVTRHDLGRENFEKEIWKWKEKHGGRIQQQLRKIGSSLDWSREGFTMDAKQSKAVQTAFIKMFNEGLIYRADRLVNWSCELQSTISDIEVESLNINSPVDLIVPGYKDPVRFGLLSEFAYKFDDNNEIVVATTRPETMLGDVAIAVHPEDKRYVKHIGRNVQHPFLDKLIPIVADLSVDREFGTGAVKITPAHDRNDFEVALKHGLPALSVIDQSGKMNGLCGVFSGMKRYDARTAVLKALDDKGLLRDVKAHVMCLPLCSRSRDVVELLPMAQWYVKCKEMGSAALESVKSGDLKLLPECFESVWSKWATEERDWCISRQLWWGHPIPAYKCRRIGDNEENFTWVAAESKEAAQKNAAEKLNTKPEQIICVQDTDVLDTWFSSGLYPFSSFGWPENTRDLKQLYPLNIMVTGHDILCFWVYRMVMLGAKLTGELPFSKVLLHGIVCDGNGAKMSKSRGNVIDPEDVINGISLQSLNNKALLSFQQGSLSQIEYAKTLEEQGKRFPKGIPECGADALRFSLCSRNVQTHFVHFDVEECYVNKLFCNKIWQSLKYYGNAVKNLENRDILKTCKFVDFSRIDVWILSRLSHTVQTVYTSLNEYNFHVATAALKHFLYSEICDVYIECTKINLKSSLVDDSRAKQLAANCHTFSIAFNASLRCLAPFMPFLTEELIPAIPMKENCLINYNACVDRLTFPDPLLFASLRDEDLESKMDAVLDIVSVVRQMRSNYNVTKKIKVTLKIECTDDKIVHFVNKNNELISFLTQSEGVIVLDGRGDDFKSSMWSFANAGKCKVHLLVSDDFNAADSLKLGQDKLDKRREKILKTLKKLEAVMGSDGYKINASEEVQRSHAEKILLLREDLQKFDH